MSADRIDIYIGKVGRDEVLKSALGDDVKNIKTAESGKPYIPNGPEFNLSHSGEVVACAVSEIPVGIDVELIKDRRISKVLKLFNPREREYIEEKPEEEKLKEFFRAWTVKEAVCKLKGCGIRKKELGEIIYFSPECFVKSWIFGEEYVLTICAEHECEIYFHGVGEEVSKISPC